MIIDSGSCANVVSLSMIKKLNLQTSVHPHPYNIRWLNQSKGLQVNSRCLISFSIGKNYQDELWFDVILMDACHMLLGQPWLFDRKVINNGYLNTYSFTKDGKKLTLTPLAPSQLYKKPSTKKPHRLDLFLSFSEPLLRASHHEFRAFRDWILTNLDEPETTSLKHPLAMALLQTFPHVFPDEIPAILPPKRDIQHHIDLIHGAVIQTNQPTK